MGGAVSINAPKIDQKTLFMQDLVNNRDTMEDLFKEITVYGKKDKSRSSKSDFMSLAEILLYVEKDQNFDLSRHYKGMVEMIKESFYYLVGYKKNVRLEIALKRFHHFMYTMFMFSHLWKVFTAADDHIGDDSIFVGEFIRAREKIRHLDGITFIKEITDEEWKEEFKNIDSGSREGGNGWISFREFATYCCTAITTPEEYAKAAGVSMPDEVMYKGPRKSVQKQIEFRGAIQHHVAAMVPSATVRRSSTNSFKSRSNSVLGSKMKVKKQTDKLTTTKEKKRKETSSGSKKPDIPRQVPLKKKSMKKRSLKTSVIMHSESSPTLSIQPVHCDKNILPMSDDDFNSNHSTPAIDPPPPLSVDNTMDECSSPIDVIPISTIVASEKKREENSERIPPRPRPLYRPPSAGDIHRQVCEYRTWVDNAALPGANCKNWVATDDDAEAFALTDHVKDTETMVAGFGIHGIDRVAFAYNMDETHAEATEHKKYLTRRKPKEKLWQPRHVTRRFEKDLRTTMSQKFFN